MDAEEGLRKPNCNCHASVIPGSVLRAFEYLYSQFWFWTGNQRRNPCSSMRLLSNSIATQQAWQHEGSQMLNTLHHVT